MIVSLSFGFFVCCIVCFTQLLVTILVFKLWFCVYYCFKLILVLELVIEFDFVDLCDVVFSVIGWIAALRFVVESFLLGCTFALFLEVMVDFDFVLNACLGVLCGVLGFGACWF